MQYVLHLHLDKGYEKRRLPYLSKKISISNSLRQRSSSRLVCYPIVSITQWETIGRKYVESMSIQPFNHYLSLGGNNKSTLKHLPRVASIGRRRIDPQFKSLRYPARARVSGWSPGWRCRCATWRTTRWDPPDAASVGVADIWRNRGLVLRVGQIYGLVKLSKKNEPARARPRRSQKRLRRRGRAALTLCHAGHADKFPVVAALPWAAHVDRLGFHGELYFFPRFLGQFHQHRQPLAGRRARRFKAHLNNNSSVFKVRDSHVTRVEQSEFFLGGLREVAGFERE